VRAFVVPLDVEVSRDVHWLQVNVDDVIISISISTSISIITVIIIISISIIIIMLILILILVTIIFILNSATLAAQITSGPEPGEEGATTRENRQRQDERRFEGSSIVQEVIPHFQVRYTASGEARPHCIPHFRVGYTAIIIAHPTLPVAIHRTVLRSFGSDTPQCLKPILRFRVRRRTPPSEGPIPHTSCAIHRN
jgi:hypothetical protein